MTTVDEAVLAARVVLGWLIEPGNKDLHELVLQHGPVETLKLVTAGMVPRELAESALSRLQGQDPAAIAGELMDTAGRLGVRIAVPESPDWPSALDDLAFISTTKGINGRIDRDTYPPQALWLRGPVPLEQLSERAVSMVGARAASNYGLHMAAELAYSMASRGWIVISGGAMGIDAAVHRGALAATEYGGSTAAVLACGVDQPYPHSNTALFEQIVEKGLLISEWPPGNHPHRTRFLIRNRVIAALSRGTVLVEASLRSGARFTLRRARELGRSTMVVPGPATAASFVGNHEELRRDGEDRARLVTRADHVAEEVGPIGDLAMLEQGPAHELDGLSGLEQRLVDAVPRRGAVTAEQIAAVAGVGLRETLAVLPTLALRGYLRRHVDGRYCLLA